MQSHEYDFDFDWPSYMDGHVLGASLKLLTASVEFFPSLVEYESLERCIEGSRQLLHSFEHRVITVWNSLPSHIVCSPSLASFKKTLKRYDLSKFCIVFA